MTDDEIKEACRLAHLIDGADKSHTVTVGYAAELARALLAVVAQRDAERTERHRVERWYQEARDENRTADQRGYQRALDEVAAWHDERVALMMVESAQHRDIGMYDTAVAVASDAALHEAMAARVRGWAHGIRAKPGGDRE